MSNNTTPYMSPEKSKNNRVDRNILQGASILLVEDNVINQDVAMAMLHQRGMHVDVAENGEQAVEMVRGNEYDCVLMDLQMPVMDGYTATRIIRKELRFSKLPILAMTAKVLDIDIKNALDSGMNCHISKPVDLELLLNEMAYWINHQKGQQNKIMSDCLGKIGGSKELFIKILTVFVEKHTADYNNVINLLEDGMTTEAIELVHSLKGVAPVVGADNLHAVTVELEAALMNESATDQTALLDNLKTSLQETLFHAQEYIASNKE